MAETFLRLIHTSTVEAESEPAQRGSFSIQAVSVVSSVIIASAMIIPAVPLLGWDPPLWLQPTVVGLIWGNLFLAGFWMGNRHTKVGELALFVVALALLTSSFQRLTDFSLADSLLFTVAILTAGWLTIRFDSSGIQARGAYERSQPGTTQSGFNSASRVTLRQWSIFDLFFAMTLTACLCHALGNLSASPYLLISVFSALVAGVFCSWGAYHWAWSDHWSIWRPATILLGLSVMVLYLFFRSPPGTSNMDVMRWLLTGPINVIAAQSVTVLAGSAFVRWQLRHISPHRADSAFLAP